MAGRGAQRRLALFVGALLLAAAAGAAAIDEAELDENWDGPAAGQQGATEQKAEQQQQQRGRQRGGEKEGDEENMVVLIFVSAIIAAAVGMWIYNTCTQSSSDKQARMRLLHEQLANLPPCERCGQKLVSSRLCDNCQVIVYCSPDCSEKDKARHSLVCDRLRQIRLSHEQGGGAPAGREAPPPGPPAGSAPAKGYFADWTADDGKILRDAVTYFAKYFSKLSEFAASELRGKGRGIVLADVSTERFKPLHCAEDPIRLMYITQRAISAHGGSALSLFDCDLVSDLLSGYNPQQGFVVAFTNGMNYVNRLDARCPVVALSFDREQAIKNMQSLSSAQIVTQTSHKSAYN
eukprot:TRINITY_DN44719_c0_g1_i1.p1 TRINITY_DN44719_c0_g1~~TRINITY_DN44719_c0_g1_i1.p1  ORF type:complete len:349 (+),score=110.70 TRINITY_DN44719_c0_g1_i1:87-1133(+)